MRSLFSDIQALGISQKEMVKGSDEVLADRKAHLLESGTSHDRLWSGAIWLEHRLVRPTLREAGVIMETLLFSL